MNIKVTKSSGDEELLQRGYIGGMQSQEQSIGKYTYYNLGATTINVLQKHNLIPAGNYENIKARKPDGLIIDKTSGIPRVVAVVENKPSSTNATVGLKQACEVGYALGAKVCFAFNGNKTIAVVPVNDDGDYENLIDEQNNNIETDFKNTKGVETLLQEIDLNLVGNKIVQEPAKNPSKLARNVWQLTWQLTKQNPSRALATFVETFLFKYLSDLGVLTTNQHGQRIDFEYLFTELPNKIVGGQKNTKEMCLKYYKQVIRPYIKETLFPAEQNGDGTTILNGFVFDDNNDDHCKAFYQILDVFNKEGKLKNIDKEFKSRLFEDFLKNTQGVKGLGQFFTPRTVMAGMVEMADVRNTLKDGANVNDPACGVGGFLLETIANRVGDFYFKKNDSTGKLELKSRINYAGHDVANGQELNDNLTIILAKANFIIYLADLLRKHPNFTTEFAKQFNSVYWSYNKTSLGSLSEVKENHYDLTFSNPPYVTSGSSIIKTLIDQNGLSNYYTKDGEGLEGLFMEKIVRELKPGGAGFIIVPDGIALRNSDKELRNWMLEECFLDAVISLPKKTFYTTQKKTYIFCLRKKPELTNDIVVDSQRIQKHPVMNFIVTDIGETLDEYRLKTDTSNYVDAVKNFKIFKSVYVNNYNTDEDNNTYQTQQFIDSAKSSQLLRVVPVEKYKNAKWDSESHFTHDELVALGVKDDILIDDISSVKTKMADFGTLIKDLTERVNILVNNVEHGFEYKKVKLSKVFDFDKSKTSQGLTKENIHSPQMKGDIPVYSATKEENKVHGKIKDNLPNINYSQNCLTITKNGSVGIIYYRDHKFATTSDVLPLVLDDEYKETINYEYLKETIYQYLLDKGYSWANKLSPNILKEMEIEIPVLPNGKYDIYAQQDIVKVQKEIASIKEQITELTEQFVKTNFSTVKKASVENDLTNDDYGTVSTTNKFKP